MDVRDMPDEARRVVEDVRGLIEDKGLTPSEAVNQVLDQTPAIGRESIYHFAVYGLAVEAYTGATLDAVLPSWTAGAKPLREFDEDDLRYLDDVIHKRLERHE
jgi:hypothetical protein